jgi:hypothetical protein
MKKVLTTLLGLATLGVGITGMVSPTFLGKMLGVKTGGQGGHFLMRAISVRDIALGVGILSHRDQPRRAAFWVFVLAVVVSSDGLQRLPEMKNPKTAEVAKIQVIQAGAVAAGCFLTGLLLLSSRKKDDEPEYAGDKEPRENE